MKKKALKKTEDIPLAEATSIEETPSIQVITFSRRRAKSPEEKTFLLNRLLMVWLKVPQQRLGQLLSNSIHQDGSDLFFKEDLDLIEMLENWIK